MFQTSPVSKETEETGQFVLSYYFKVKQFSAFKWLYNHAKCHPNDAKMALFLLKNHKNRPAAGGFSPNPCS